MFERFVSFLKSLPGDDSSGLARDDDPRLAVAALLFHVIHADGVRDEDEVRRMRELLAHTYGIDGRELDRLMRDAEEADKEAVDLYAFTSIINRHLDKSARLEFVGLMWEMVFADGELHELEDNVVWRVAELIGVEREERVALRRRARGKDMATNATDEPDGT